MRALFGVVSLLVVLAAVGFLAARQLKVAVPVLPPGASAPSDPGPLPAAVTVREQSQQLQERVKSDIAKAMEQGAAARKEDADK